LLIPNGVGCTQPSLHVRFDTTSPGETIKEANALCDDAAITKWSSEASIGGSADPVATSISAIRTIIHPVILLMLVIL
jgi:hypothetical protein